MDSKKDLCEELIDALHGWSWHWDARFGAVLTEFDVAEEAKVRDVLRRLFSSEWDRSNIDKAPDAVQKVISHFGGLMPGQMLFSPEPGQVIFICCAWWPWGNGKIISLRLAPFSEHPVGAERIAEFKARFGM